MLTVIVSMYRRLVEVIKPQSARVAPDGVSGEGATGAKLADRLPGACLEGSVVADGFDAELVDAAGGVGRGKDEGLLGED